MENIFKRLFQVCVGSWEKIYKVAESLFNVLFGVSVRNLISGIFSRTSSFLTFAGPGGGDNSGMGGRYSNEFVEKILDLISDTYIGDFFLNQTLFEFFFVDGIVLLLSIKLISTLLSVIRG